VYKHLTQIYQKFCFGGLKTLCRNLEIFHSCTHWNNDSHLLFPKWSKSVQDQWPKGCVAMTELKKKLNVFWCHLTPKHVLALGRLLPFFCVIAHCHPLLTTFSKFCLNQFMFRRVIMENPSRDPQSEWSIGSEPIIM